MPWRISCIFLTALCLSGFTSGADAETFTNSRNLRKTNSNIEFDGENADSAAGSGGWMLNFSDDEDLAESGSGSGSGLGEIGNQGPVQRTTAVVETTTMVKTSTTTSRPLSNCEKNRQDSQQLVGRFVPRCLPNGDFDSLQCHGHPGTADCWCSDLEGREIPGTLMEAPNYPSCDDGSNLPPCTHKLLLHVRSKLVGSFRPKCSLDGQFDKVQCHGSICFCVNENTGERVTGTEVHLPDKPSCEDDATTKTMMPYQPEEKEINIDEATDPKKLPPEDVTVEYKGADRDEDKEKPDEDNKTGKNTGQGSEHQEDRVEKASEIMTQPGILAGVIGGSVVLLLCIVLLVLFIVYRMRKKDEGSYPLDEPRKTPNYNYVRAPEKEFYA